MASSVFNYGSGKLTVEKALSISSGKIKAVLNDKAVSAIKASQQSVQQIVDDGRTVYGVNTGFGILANTAISKKDTATLQYKILQSHSVGVGDAIPIEVAKLMLITTVKNKHFLQNTLLLRRGRVRALSLTCNQTAKQL